MVIATASEAWTPPASLEVAQDQLESVTNELQAIQAQLSDRDRVDGDGRRLSGYEYFQWRRKATYALAAKLREQRRIKRWIQARRQVITEIRQADQPKNVVELVGALVKALKGAIDWSEMTPSERGIVKVADQWIETKGVALLERAKQQAAQRANGPSETD